MDAAIVTETIDDELIKPEVLPERDAVELVDAVLEAFTDGDPLLEVEKVRSDVTVNVNAAVPLVTLEGEAKLVFDEEIVEELDEDLDETAVELAGAELDSDADELNVEELDEELVGDTVELEVKELDCDDDTDADAESLARDVNVAENDAEPDPVIDDDDEVETVRKVDTDDVVVSELWHEAVELCVRVAKAVSLLECDPVPVELDEADPDDVPDIDDKLVSELEED